MQKTIVIIVIVAVAALGAFYLFSGNRYGSAPAVQQNGQGGTALVPGDKQGAQAVIIQNFSFSPATLTIAKGTTVTWTNRDSVEHLIKSANFNSAPLNTSESFSFTFNEAGTFDYSCGIHPSMKGQIIVQ